MIGSHDFMLKGRSLVIRDGRLGQTAAQALIGLVRSAEMRVRVRLAVGVGVVSSFASAACMPPAPEAWLVDYPITWGISARVVDEIEYGAVQDAPDWWTRAEVLPGETLELQWFGAAPEGAHLPPPIWLFRPGAGFSGLPASDGALRDCPVPLLRSSPLCRLGEGERVRVTLGLEPPDSAGMYPRVIDVLAIASDGDVIEPAACLERALGERNPALAGCLISTRTVDVGPDWYLWINHGQQYPVPASWNRLPAEIFNAPANFNPVIEGLRVERGDGADSVTSLVADGDTVQVRPGERVAVTVVLNAEAAETWFLLQYNRTTDEYTAEMRTESPRLAARPNFPVDDYFGAGLTRSWTASSEPMTLYLQVSDGRGGFAFATLRVVGADGDDDRP